MWWGIPDLAWLGWSFPEALRFGMYGGLGTFGFKVVADLTCREDGWNAFQSMGGAYKRVVVVFAGGGDGKCSAVALGFDGGSKICVAANGLGSNSLGLGVGLAGWASLLGLCQLLDFIFRECVDSPSA